MLADETKWSGANTLDGEADASSNEMRGYIHGGSSSQSDCLLESEEVVTFSASEIVWLIRRRSRSAEIWIRYEFLDYSGPSRLTGPSFGGEGGPGV